jgi:hypothetical protein
MSNTVFHAESDREREYIKMAHTQINVFHKPLLGTRGLVILRKLLRPRER